MEEDSVEITKKSISSHDGKMKKEKKKERNEIDMDNNNAQLRQTFLGNFTRASDAKTSSTYFFTLLYLHVAERMRALIVAATFPHVKMFLASLYAMCNV